VSVTPEVRSRMVLRSGIPMALIGVNDAWM
jgi:hypothetical protein